MATSAPPGPAGRPSGVGIGRTPRVQPFGSSPVEQMVEPVRSFFALVQASVVSAGGTLLTDPLTLYR